MLRKISFTFTKGIKYIFKEIIIKFLLCYLISLIGFIIANSLKEGILQIAIINISSSLISIPIVFIAYDLYKKLLIIKSTKLINETVDQEITHIFLKFLYFSTYFYNEFECTKEQPPDVLDELLKKNKDAIFNDLSRNKHHGYFIFSIFDSFDIDIDNVLDSNKIIKFISSEEISVLQQFINHYKTFKTNFSFISDEDFIKNQKISNVYLSESTFINCSEENSTFYDVAREDEMTRTTYYFAKYRIFEEEPLLFTYKLSGNKAQELSTLLYNLYSDIYKWKKIRGISRLSYDNALVSCGRLYLDNNISFNAHMNNNISVHGGFN